MSIVRSIVLFIGISLGLSGTAPNVDEDVLAMLPVIAVVGLAFVLVEELAWRGWLQRTAQTRLPVPAAALLVGALSGACGTHLCTTRREPRRRTSTSCRSCC